MSSGMTKEIPGGASIRLGRMGMETKSLPQDTYTHIYAYATLIPIELRWAGEVVSQVAIGLATSWLYDKLKGGDGKGHRMIRIRREMIEVTPENLTRVLRESVEEQKP